MFYKSLFGENDKNPYHSDHSLAKKTLRKQYGHLLCEKLLKPVKIKQKMYLVTNYQAKGEKDIRDAWVKAIGRSVLPKAIHEDSFDESQEL